MNYILDPVSLKSVPLNSEDGKLLLTKYIIEYNKMGGEMEKAKSLKDICHTVTTLPVGALPVIFKKSRSG